MARHLRDPSNNPLLVPLQALRSQVLRDLSSARPLVQPFPSLDYLSSPEYPSSRPLHVKKNPQKKKCAPDETFRVSKGISNGTLPQWKVGTSASESLKTSERWWYVSSGVTEQSNDSDTRRTGKSIEESDTWNLSAHIFWLLQQLRYFTWTIRALVRSLYRQAGVPVFK